MVIIMPEKKIQNQLNSPVELSKQEIDSTTESEIAHLLETSEFAEFVQSIEESLDDDTTFNDLLSSKKVLGKALEVLKLQSNQR
jgi:hypothetical protein